MQVDLEQANAGFVRAGANSGIPFGTGHCGHSNHFNLVSAYGDGSHFDAFG
jgi:uncharacterized protein YjlB